MTIGQSIKKIRKDQKLSQDKLAERCGIKQQQLCQYEKDHHTPSLFVAITIADALHVTMDELIGRKI